MSTSISVSLDGPRRSSWAVGSNISQYEHVPDVRAVRRALTASAAKELREDISGVVEASSVVLLLLETFLPVPVVDLAFL